MRSAVVEEGVQLELALWVRDRMGWTGSPRQALVAIDQAMSDHDPHRFDCDWLEGVIEVTGRDDFLGPLLLASAHARRKRERKPPMAKVPAHRKRDEEVA